MLNGPEHGSKDHERARYRNDWDWTINSSKKPLKIRSLGSAVWTRYGKSPLDCVSFWPAHFTTLPTITGTYLYSDGQSE